VEERFSGRAETQIGKGNAEQMLVPSVSSGQSRDAATVGKGNAEHNA
jgi:hypothetical protein